MRVVVLAPSIYSERALAAIAALCDAGHQPVGCLTVKTASFYNVVRKVAEQGPLSFLRYALRRTGLAGTTGESASGGALDNPLLAERLARYGVTATNLATLCRQRQIPLQKCSDVNRPAALAILKTWQPGVIVYTGGGILRRPLLEIPTIGVVNTHAGVLPHYRGMNVSEWSTLNGDAVGVTTQLIDPGIDTGPILSIMHVEFTAEDTTIRRLRERVALVAVDAMRAGVETLARGDYQSTTQQQAQGKQYFVMHEKLLELAEARLRQSVGSTDACHCPT